MLVLSLPLNSVQNAKFKENLYSHLPRGNWIVVHTFVWSYDKYELVHTFVWLYDHYE